MVEAFRLIACGGIQIRATFHNFGESSAIILAEQIFDGGAQNENVGAGVGLPQLKNVELFGSGITSRAEKFRIGATAGLSAMLSSSQV